MAAALQTKLGAARARNSEELELCKAPKLDGPNPSPIHPNANSRNSPNNPNLPQPNLATCILTITLSAAVALLFALPLHRGYSLLSPQHPLCP